MPFKAFFKPSESTLPIFGTITPPRPRSPLKNKLKFFIYVPSWIIDPYILQKKKFFQIEKKIWLVNSKALVLHQNQGRKRSIINIKKNTNMKTLNDLFELAALQVELNKGKAFKFHVIIDTSYNWVSLIKEYLDQNGDSVKNSSISHMSFDTPEQLQACYWVIYNKVRTK